MREPGQQLGGNLQRKARLAYAGRPGESEQRHGFLFQHCAHLGHLGLPDLFPRRRIDRDGVTVEQVVHDLPVGVERPAVDHVTAGDPDGSRVHVGAVLPLQRVTFPREVEGIEHVGVRRHRVHRVVHHQRLPFVPAEHARGEGPDSAEPLHVRRFDAGQCAVAGRGVVLGGHGPLAAVRRRRGARGRGRPLLWRPKGDDATEEKCRCRVAHAPNYIAEPPMGSLGDDDVVDEEA